MSMVEMKMSECRDLLGDIIIGTFVSEIKNRFLCHVKIGGEVYECYIPSSCRLSNFLSLEGKQVLLMKTRGNKTRTKYAVYAVKFRKNYLLLNLSLTNRVIEENIHRRIFCKLGSRRQVVREQTLEGYKSDLYIKDTRTIIEIKSLLTTNKTGVFPTVYSERSIVQLKKIRNLLRLGYRVCYMLVSLNPYIEYIVLNNAELEFYNLFMECLENGMVCMGVALEFVNGKPTVRNLVNIRCVAGKG